MQTFADHWQLYEPRDPKAIEMEWPQRRANPLCMDKCYYLSFDPDQVPPRVARWQWWRQLALAGIFVRSLYKYTSYVDPQSEKPINGSVGVGSAGQEVVKCVYGTVLWMTGDTKRVYISSGGEEFLSRLRCVFAPMGALHQAAQLQGAHLPLQFQGVLHQQPLGFQM